MRVAVIAALAIVVIALGVILFGGGSGHKYNLLFQNASQLVPDNQVLIGGQPVGSVESIGLTDNNLAEVKISVEQELHEGSTAVIRATSLSGVANHYVSINRAPTTIRRSKTAPPSASPKRRLRPTSTSSSTPSRTGCAAASPTSSRARRPSTRAAARTPTWRPSTSAPR